MSITLREADSPFHHAIYVSSSEGVIRSSSRLSHSVYAELEILKNRFLLL
jgi:hypothetical protein